MISFHHLIMLYQIVEYKSKVIFQCCHQTIEW